MATKELFGRNLRDFLDKKRKSQRDLAKYVDATDATVSRWVNGEALPRPEHIDNICTFLSCQPEDLFRDKTDKRAPSHEELIAKEIWERPLLLKLFLRALKADDESIRACITLIGK